MPTPRRPIRREAVLRPLLREGETCWRVRSATRVAVLVDGAAYFAALASALARAERQILIVGWDFNSRTRLLRDEATHESVASTDDDRPPPEFGAMLDHLVRRRPELDVYVLGWDFAVVYALEREALPLFRMGVATHGRLRFRLDDRHPLGGSHHQKLVVVDDRVAFAGGLDITACRWDTPAHAPDEPRRSDPGFDAYGPFHDVQLAVEGEVAAALGELARTRWRRATGRSLRPPTAAGDPWPPDLEPDFRDVDVGVARTRPALEPEDEDVREVESLHLEAIRAARRVLYFENQYFSATRVALALAERLEEPDGPEVVLVLPWSSGGWLEEATMGLRRQMLLRRLAEADRHDRLRVFHPHRPGVPDASFTVHAKLVVVDDRLLRVGSSNLSNRSMGLDSECDLALEAGDDDALRARIRGVRDALLAEHLDRPVEAVAEAIDAEGSVVRAIDALAGEGRTLRPIPLPDEREWPTEVLSASEMLDPERPIALGRWLEDHLDVSPEAAPWSVARRLAVAALVVGAVAGGLRLLLPADTLTPATLVEVRRALADGPATLPLAVLIAFVAGLAPVPLTWLGLVYGALLSPLTAGLALAIGAAASAAPGFWLGRLLWRDAVRALSGRHLDELSRALARRGPWAIALLRQATPSAFGVVNLVAGASHVPFRTFLIGTLIGVIPGALLLSLASHFAWTLAAWPVGSLGLLAFGAAALFAARRGVRRRRRRRREEDAAREHEDGPPEADDGRATG